MSAAHNEESSKPAGSDTYSIDERTLCDPSDDERSHHGRPSSEMSEADHDILESEDERERLLTTQEGITGLFGQKGVKIGKRESRQKTANKGQKKAGNGETSSLMYEMEEGVGVSSSSLSRHSSESDEKRLLATRTQMKIRKSRIWRRIAIYSCIVALFIILLSVVYRVSTPAGARSTPAMISNGTSLFAPTTIVISLDGFRADFLYRNLTPTLNKFIESGVSPQYMLPSFPSVTFPNHFTLATGLYPEAHGIVGNTFWDPSLEKEFYYTDPGRSLQPFWWNGEPFWSTAEKQNRTVAVHMWPGSEAHIGDIQPVYVDKYNGSELLPLKVNRILGFLDLPGPLDLGAKVDQPRPQLIAAYVPNVDSDGHKYGPNSTEIRQTISDADAMLGSILKGLEQRNLTDIVNVVVVSDHGMATTDTSRLIQFEELVDPKDIDHIDGWPLYGLRPKIPDDLDRIYTQLAEKAKSNPNFDVYLRDKNMPERYHFSKNERIAPLWIVPKTGWAIVTKDEFDVAEGQKNGDVYHPRGLHGYDYEHPLMRAIFVARGPAFPHQPNSRLEPFQNIEVYNIICDSIGIKPSPNNGTLRLPLKPVGLHNDTNAPPYHTPADSGHNATFPATSTNATFTTIASLTPGIENTLPPGYYDAPATATTSKDPPSAPAASTPAKHESWWEWLTHKADHIEEWVDDFLHSHTSGSGDKDDKKPVRR